MLEYNQKMCKCYKHRLQQCDKAHQECLVELEDLNDDLHACERKMTTKTLSDGELIAFGALADYKRRLLNHIQKSVGYKDIYTKNMAETKKTLDIGD